MFKYKVLAFFIVVVYFFQSLFLPYGGIGADGLSYFGMASDFPKLKTNLFPLIYPALLRFFYESLGDYFWAYKVVNFLMVVVLLIFSWFRKFYFKETVLLFTGKSLFFAMNGAVSESLFIFIFYFLLYVVHSFLSEKLKAVLFVFWASLFVVLMFGVRYSGIFIYMSLVLFGFWLWLERVRVEQLRIYLAFLLLSGLGIFAYLGFNQMYFGSFAGEHLRGGRGEFQFVYLFRDFLGMTNVVDPFIGIKPASNGYLSLMFQVVLMLVDVFLFFKFVKWYRSNKINFKGSFPKLLWIVTIVYTVGLFVSGLFQQIEEMNVRMLAIANFAFFFSALVLYFQVQKKDQLVFRISFFFFLFLTAYNWKDAGSFLDYKSQMVPQLSRFKHKKYLYNNEKSMVTTTVYEVPIINKEVKYQHTNKQIGELKQTVIGAVNPQIKWLKYDTVRDKSQVLYTSQLKLKN